MELATLRTDARYHISPQLTSTDYPDTDLDRNLNRWYRTVLGWILPIQGDWEIEGDIIYRDFQQAVTDYEVPSKLLRIYKGEVMYTTGGSFVPLDFISLQRAQGSTEGNTTRTTDDPSRPTAELFGDIVQVRPAPEETVVNGFKLWVQLDFVELDTNNDVPNLMEPVQRALTYGAALDYALAEEMYKKADELRKMIYGDPSKREDTGVKGMVEALYSNRSGARRHRLSARRTRFN